MASSGSPALSVVVRGARQWSWRQARRCPRGARGSIPPAACGKIDWRAAVGHACGGGIAAGFVSGAVRRVPGGAPRRLCYKLPGQGGVSRPVRPSRRRRRDAVRQCAHSAGSRGGPAARRSLARDLRTRAPT